jgi:hypothetical protein
MHSPDVTSDVEPAEHANFPAPQLKEQLMHDVPPVVFLYLPMGHSMQSVSLPLLVEGLYFPGGQSMQLDALATETFDVDPLAHAYFPAAHCALHAEQSVSTPCGFDLLASVYRVEPLYLPDGQGSQPVMIGSVG